MNLELTCESSQLTLEILYLCFLAAGFSGKAADLTTVNTGTLRVFILAQQVLSTEPSPQTLVCPSS